MTRSPRPGDCRSRAGSADAAAAASGIKPKPFYQNESTILYCGDCRTVVPYLAEPVDLLLTDPPYSHVVHEKWDQINHSALSRLLDELFRALRPHLADNAAVYVFAWPTFAGQLEYIMSRHFNVLNHITWCKREPDGRKNGNAAKAGLETLRNYYPETERIIFAETQDSDGQYTRMTCAFGNEVFRPIIEYFQEARRRCGLSGAEIRAKMFELTGKRYVFERHAFTFSQWEFPAEDQFLAAATFMPLGDHGDALESYRTAKARYDKLRRQWEHLRRCHKPNRRNYTDLWNYRPLLPGNRDRVHPCQKPRAMLRDMIETSSRPGALILDCFAGSGETAIAARETGRRCILIEQDPEMCQTIARRLAQ